MSKKLIIGLVIVGAVCVFMCVKGCHKKTAELTSVTVSEVVADAAVLK